MKLLEINYEHVTEEITSFIRNYVKSSNRDGVVLGLSGGIDSTVTAYLCVKALGRDRVLGLILPEDESTPAEDVKDALEIAKTLGIEHYVINITPIVNTFKKLLPDADYVSWGNLKVRIRMTILYFFANSRNLLVVGTGDKSELLIGYFTKYGDGASDIAPITGLYKTQVRALARYLGVPEKIIKKKSSPRLWPGHLAEKELGITYEALDPILNSLIDLKQTPEEVSKKLNTSLDIINAILERISANEHKRKGPIMLLQLKSIKYA